MKEKLRCIIWDVDDTLYDASTGFTSHRNGPIVWQFMVDVLKFPSLEVAQEVRDTYFERYHATAKALMVAQQEGKFPENAPQFQTQDLSQYWADNLDFTVLPRKSDDFLQQLQSLPFMHVAFSNGPRIYVKRVLQQLGLWGSVFLDHTLFAVDDVLPHCKPEKEAFDTIFDRLQVTADECIMVEDSMKNIRRAKELGMRTILIVGQGKMNLKGPYDDDGKYLAVSRVSATKMGDAPILDDPAVDAIIETVEDLQTYLPHLWGENPLQAFEVLRH